MNCVARTPRYAGSAGGYREAIRIMSEAGGKTELAKVVDWRIQGDIVIIEITDEETFPSIYEVRPDGRIIRKISGCGP